MSAHFTAIYELAKAATCALCARRPCRVAVDRDDDLTPDVLCNPCFESAPMRFKLTSAQDVFRELVRGGCHPKMAIRAAATATRDEPMRDMSAEIAWFEGLMRECPPTTDGETP